MKNKKVNLVSQLNNPVYVSYDGSTIVVPPKCRKLRVEESKLGALPSGVRKLKSV